MNAQVKVVPQGKGISAMNVEGVPVADAKVFVNGEAVPYDPVFFQYRLQKDTPAPFDLRIEHPTQGSIHIPQFFYDSDKVYLLAGSAASIWQNGVRIPVLPATDAYYLTLKNQHQHSEAEQADCDRQIETWTSALQGKVQRVLMGDEDEVCYRKLTVAGKADGLVAEMEARESVDFIGPLLHLPLQDHLPAGLTNKVEIKFLPGTQQAEIDALVQEMNLVDLQSTPSSDGPNISARFNAPAGWDLLPKVTQLNARDNIRFANHVLMIQVTH